MQIVDHAGVAFERALFLIVQNADRISGISGEEHEQVVFEIEQRIVGNGQGFGITEPSGWKSKR